MANLLTPGTQLYVYLLRSLSREGTFIEALFTNKAQAEGALRAFQAMDPRSDHTIIERVTEPHEA